MARAIRSVSVERGRDVRRYTLVAFGGAGPLHAIALARELDIPRVIVPPAPGTLAALGLLVAARRADASLSRPMPCDRTRDVELRSILHELTEQVLAELRTEGIEFIDARTALHVDCRYEGQSHELRMPVEGGPSFALLAEAFHSAHRARFGFAHEGVAVEAVTFRATALGPQEGVDTTVSDRNDAAPAAHRVVGGSRVPVYRRGDLAVGARLEGPAVVTELDSTCWIDADSAATVHAGGSLLIDL
jgi:N-methylhydantoinase A